MSGICGIGQRDATAAGLWCALDLLLDDLSDFGPTVHRWQEVPQLALGQRQELIYRRDHLEQQPVVAGDLSLIADTRLIGAGDVARALGMAAKGHQEPSDSALILAAWQHWGEQALDRLDGEFCFALWEAATRRLTLVRDHLGSRPLYYAPWAGGCAFSTSLTGLLRLPRSTTQTSPAPPAPVDTRCGLAGRRGGARGLWAVQRATALLPADRAVDRGVRRSDRAAGLIRAASGPRP